MKIHKLDFIVSFLLFCGQVTTDSAQIKLRGKRENTGIQLKVFENNQVDMTAVNITAIIEACNKSLNKNSNKGRIRRSIHDNNITTTEIPLNDDIDMSILSPEFIKCMLISLEPECFVKFTNGSVLVPLYGMLFDKSNYVIKMGLLYICPDFFPDHTSDSDKYPVAVDIAAFVCACLSVVCIVLHLLMFALVKKLRNLPGYCLASLCIALLNAYIILIVQHEVNDVVVSNTVSCTVVGLFQMYIFLAAFFWMNTLAYDVWKSIRMATTKFRLTTDRPIMIQYARYSLYAWGTPMMILLLSIIVHFSISEHSKYRLTFELGSCWFKHKQALTLYVAGPIFVLLGTNILFFAFSFYMISISAMSKSQCNAQGGCDLWSRLFLSLRLGSVMGFVWFFGILANLTSDKWMWYLYSICSSLQGVFIFFSFTVSERTRKACKKALQGRKFSVSPTQISSQQGTSISNRLETQIQ